MGEVSEGGLVKRIRLAGRQIAEDLLDFSSWNDFEREQRTNEQTNEWTTERTNDWKNN